MNGFNVSPLPSHAAIGRPGFAGLESAFGPAAGYGIAPSLDSINGGSFNQDQNQTEDDKIVTYALNARYEAKPMAEKELNWMPGDLVMGMVTKESESMLATRTFVREGWAAPITIVSVPRWNLMAISPKGRSDMRGFNGLANRYTWKFMGGIAEGKYDPTVGITINPMKRSLIKLPQNGAIEGDSIWLMMIKTPRSSVAEYNRATSYRAPHLKGLFDYGMSISKHLSELPDMEFGSEPVLTQDQVAAAIKNATKPYTRSERAYIDTGALKRHSLAMASSNVDEQLTVESLEDGDPLVWTLAPWVGPCDKRPPVWAYNSPGEWYGTIYHVGRYMHSTTGPLGGNPVLNARIHEYYHPQDNSDAFREEGKLISDAEVMLLL
jgi:hypothetical protein